MTAIRQYRRVFATFFRNSFMRELAFRGNFFITLITRGFWFSVQVVMFDLIYRNVNRINDWSREEYFGFMATGMLVNAIVEAFFMPNCARFSELIRTGDLDFARKPRPQMLDARLMRRAVINLVTNAVQASPTGGRIVVRVVDEPDGDSPGARLEVSDDGPGIPPSVQARIFEPFFTTKSFGTGLGLSIVKHVADVHHGEVTVRSGEGLGTTFTLRLPSSAA